MTTINVYTCYEIGTNKPLTTVEFWNDEYCTEYPEHKFYYNADESIINMLIEDFGKQFDDMPKDKKELWADEFITTKYDYIQCKLYYFYLKCGKR